MGRKVKYSKELKLEIVKRYLKGESANALANEYALLKRGPHTIWDWVRKYKALGENGFELSSNNKTYSKDFKLKVINEYLSGKDSFQGLANTYNISTHEIVRKWVLAYNNGKEIKDYDPKGEVYAMKSRKTTLEERLEIVKYVLDNNNDYKGAAKRYNVPYSNVFNWVKKYNSKGEEGLSDKRGRSSNKSSKELTELEKKDIEIEKLKRQLEQEQKVNEVLKKNLEIRERLERNSRVFDNKTSTKR